MSVYHGPGPPGSLGVGVNQDAGGQVNNNPVDNDRAERQDEGSNGTQGGPTWATVTKNLKKYKLLVINFEKSTNYTVTEEEIARLVFKKLEVPRNKIRGIDTNVLGRIILEIEEDYDEALIPLHHSHEVRRGLRTQPKLNHLALDNQVWVRIYRTTFQDSDDDILDMLRPFGRFTSNLQRLTYQKRETGSDELKLLGGVQKGDRTVRMALSKQCPTWMFLKRKDGSGHRVKVTHVNQVKTCPRCNKGASECLGGGNATVCEEADKDFVKPTNEEAYMFWASQEDTLNIGLEFSDKAVLEIRNLPHDVEALQIAKWMAEFGCMVEVDQFEVPDESKPGVRFIR